MIQSSFIIIGLLLDIVGVIGLFNSVTKGLTKIENIHPQMFNSGFFGFDKASPEQQAILDLKKDINQIIEATNERNNKIHKASKKWLYLIIAGFLFQLIAVIFSLDVVN